MKEEEIIKIIKEKIILDFNCYNPIDKIELQAIQGLLDLYNKEKEKNKMLKELYDDACICIAKDCIEKDKIREKIKECREILYSFEKELELKANKDKFIHKESMNCLLGQISILQSLLEEE